MNRDSQLNMLELGNTKLSYWLVWLKVSYLDVKATANPG